ncbi:MAG: acyl carrier protein [Candidatus Rokubacteria bacterium]|nr:acyl carrier protein [Candidatus Rokubacteria bacterium]
MKPELVSLILNAVQELGEHNGVPLPTALDGDTPLFGRDGLLDSLGLVTLVVAVEQAIEDELGVSVSLADERALSQRASPYRTVGALADYAGSLIRAAA